MYDRDEIERVDIYDQSNHVVRKWMVRDADEALDLTEGKGAVLILFGSKSEAILAKERYVDEAATSTEQRRRMDKPVTAFLPRVGAYSLYGHRFVVHFKGQQAD
jgi:hypothetical protein